MCCTCAGSCNHVGNHTFCVAHGGSVYQPAVGTGTGTNGWPWIMGPATPCDHCFCEDAIWDEHKQCCMCSTRRHVQFIPAPVRG